MTPTPMMFHRPTPGQLSFFSLSSVSIEDCIIKNIVLDDICITQTIKKLIGGKKS